MSAAWGHNLHKCDLEQNEVQRGAEKKIGHCPVTSAVKQSHHTGLVDICTSEEVTKFIGWKWTISFLCLFLTFPWIYRAPFIFSIQSFGSLYWLTERQQCWFIVCGKRIIVVINESHPYLDRNTAGASLNTAVAWDRIKSPSYSRRATEIMVVSKD